MIKEEIASPRSTRQRHSRSSTASICSYELLGETWVAAVVKNMAKHDELLADARARLEQAQAIYKRFYDKHHHDVRYKRRVWLRAVT